MPKWLQMDVYWLYALLFLHETSLLLPEDLSLLLQLPSEGTFTRAVGQLTRPHSRETKVGDDVGYDLGYESMWDMT